MNNTSIQIHEISLSDAFMTFYLRHNSKFCCIVWPDIKIIHILAWMNRDLVPKLKISLKQNICGRRKSKNIRWNIYQAIKRRQRGRKQESWMWFRWPDTRIGVKFHFFLQIQHRKVKSLIMGLVTFTMK